MFTFLRRLFVARKKIINGACAIIERTISTARLQGPPDRMRRILHAQLTVLLRAYFREFVTHPDLYFFIDHPRIDRQTGLIRVIVWLRASRKERYQRFEFTATQKTPDGRRNHA